MSLLKTKVRKSNFIMATHPTTIFVKKKGAVPNKDSEVILTVFVFNSLQTLFNTVHQRVVLNRFAVDTDVYTVYWKDLHTNLLAKWSHSDHPDDTVADSMLPLPNLKTYYWSDPRVREKISRKTRKLSHTKRKRIDISSIKKHMIDELIAQGMCILKSCVRNTLGIQRIFSSRTGASYVLEIRSCLFDSILSEGEAIYHVGKFKIDRPYSQSELNKIDCRVPKLENDLEGFLKKFGSLTQPNQHSSGKFNLFSSFSSPGS